MNQGSRVMCPATYASIDLLREAVGFKPETSIEEGLQRFADWYVDYYKIKSSNRLKLIGL